MSERPLLLKVLLRERHWQNYATFTAEYDKAARRIDPDLAGATPAAPNCTAGSPARSAACRTPTTAACWRRCSPAGPLSSYSSPPPETMYASGRSSGPLRPEPGTTGPPVFAAPSVGLRPFIEQAFAA